MEPLPPPPIDLEQLAPTIVPKGLEVADLDSWKPAWFGSDGIDMREAEQLELLRSWAGYGDLFAALRADSSINPLGIGEPFIHNGWYGTPDAETYAAMIATTRPKRIIEVGAGFSTLIARKTIEHLGLRTHITVVDPQPRADVEAAADEIVKSCAEDVAVESLVPRSAVLLFIDSSHVTRTGGDVPYLYNKVVPRLAKGSIVHAHDIYIPFDYPPRLQALLYTEQYVLHSLLTWSYAFEVLFASAFMSWRHRDEMLRVFGEMEGGGALWFRLSRSGIPGRRSRTARAGEWLRSRRRRPATHRAARLAA